MIPFPFFSPTKVNPLQILSFSFFANTRSFGIRFFNS
jgi:hypothetical protein